MMAGMITLILTGRLRVLRTRRALVLENLALRQQLAVLQRPAPRPRLRRSDRLFWVLLSQLWRGWADAVSIVQPETVIRWQRTVKGAQTAIHAAAWWYSCSRPLSRSRRYTSPVPAQAIGSSCRWLCGVANPSPRCGRWWL